MNPLRDGLISEEMVRSAIIATKGDLFIAASYIGVTPRQLDSFIRGSQDIQLLVASVNEIKRDDDYHKISVEQFENRLEDMTRAYRIDALKEIHKLAMMSFDSAALAEVKLKAAIQLRGTQSDTRSDNNTAIMAELNQLYHQSAPRIRSVRIAQVEFDG